MRELNYILGIDSITPSAVQEAGFQCEYNATKAIFALTDELAEHLKNQSGNPSWSVEAVNAEGALSVYPLTFENNKAELLLPTEITIPGTTAKLQVSVTMVDEDYNMITKQYFPTVKVRFGPSVTATLDSNEYDRYARNLVGTMKIAVSAAELSVQSATDAKAAADATQGIPELCAATKEASDLAAEAQKSASDAAISAKGYSVSAESATLSAWDATNKAEADRNLASQYASAAMDAADRAEAAAGKSWAVYKSVTLESAAAAYIEQVELVCDTSKGLCIRVILPAQTTLPNNRLTAYINLNGNRQLTVRGESWATSDSETVGCFIIRPVAEVWNAEVAPYVKTVAGIVGDLNYAEGDKVRYVKFQTNEDNPIPAGTKIEFWGLQ